MKFGPLTFRRNDGTILVLVPTGPHSFKAFKLDGAQYHVLEDYDEGNNNE